MELKLKRYNSPLLFGFILVICCVTVYYPTLHNGLFCWDDKAVAFAPAFRQLSLNVIIHAFSSFHIGLYHPLTSISFMFDYALGHGEPFPFHLTNIALHCANTLLLFILLKRLTGNLIVAFLTCILFAVHPIHIESVAWITSRKDLLFSFFFLLSTVCYINYLEKPKKTIRYFLVLGCVLLALLSKIQAVSLPFIFLLIDYYHGEELKAKLFLDKLPILFLCLIFGWINILAQNEYGYITYGYSFSFPEKILLFIYSVSIYFIKVLIPYPLSVFYPFPFKPGEHISTSIYAVPVIFSIIISLIMYFRRKDRKQYIFGLLFFFLNVLIVAGIGFNRDAIIADRYAYLSSAGILFIIAVLVSEAITSFKKYRIPIRVILMTLLVWFSLMTFQRCILWRNPVKLFTDALTIYNDSEIILNTLAAQEIESGKYEEAIVHLDKAIVISPTYGQAYFNRGIAHTKTGNLAASINDFTSAVTLNPGYDDAYFARGNAYMKLNDLKSALSDFSTTIRFNPTHFGAFQNRAIARGNIEDYAGALNDLNTAIALNPDFAATYYLRGIALFNTGMDGCLDLEKALSMGYRDAERAIKYYCK